MHFLQGHLDREKEKGGKSSRKQSVSWRDYLYGMSAVWHFQSESIYCISDKGCRSAGDGNQLSEDMLRALFWNYFLFPV